MKKRTKQLQFDTTTVKAIFDRDQDCIFCRKFGPAPHDNQIFDCCHIVNKSQGGLGIEENGVKGCRYHHHEIDNGNGSELREFAEEYLRGIYPNWSKEVVTYNKWGFLKGE